MREDQEVHVVTITELSEMLRSCRATIVRHVDQGMPVIDISTTRPGARPKRALRFEVKRVLQYLARRDSGSGRGTRKS